MRFAAAGYGRGGVRFWPSHPAPLSIYFLNFFDPPSSFVVSPNERMDLVREQFDYKNEVGDNAGRFNIDLYMADGSDGCGSFVTTICDKPEIGCKDSGEKNDYSFNRGSTLSYFARPKLRHTANLHHLSCREWGSLFPRLYDRPVPRKPAASRTCLDPSKLIVPTPDTPAFLQPPQDGRDCFVTRTLFPFSALGLTLAAHAARANNRIPICYIEYRGFATLTLTLTLNTQNQRLHMLFLPYSEVHSFRVKSAVGYRGVGLVPLFGVGDVC